MSVDNMPADYEHSVFVSYRWLTESWKKWVSQIFVPTLADAIAPTSLDLKKRPVWWDDIEPTPGMKWPPRLAQKLARSQVMVALMCENYFLKDSWCLWEYETMRIREEQRPLGQPPIIPGLIVPLIIQDGDNLDDDIKRRCPIDLVKPKLANPYMTKGSPQRRKLYDLLRDTLAQKITECVNSAPQFDPNWETVAYEAVEIRLDQRSSSVQSTLPTLKTSQLRQQPQRSNEHLRGS